MTVAGSRQAAVQDDHNEHWKVKGRKCCPQSYGRAGKQMDVTPSIRDNPFSPNCLPAEDGGSPEDKGHQPGCSNHQTGHPACPAHWVAEGPYHTEVPIQTDDQEIHDGGAAHHIVQNKPHVAENSSQGPVALQQVERVQVHGKQANDQIGHRQAQQEVVVYGAQAGVDFDGQDHQCVAEHGDDANRGSYHGNEDELSRVVGTSLSDWRLTGGINTRPGPRRGVELRRLSHDS